MARAAHRGRPVAVNAGDRVRDPSVCARRAGRARVPRTVPGGSDGRTGRPGSRGPDTRDPGGGRPRVRPRPRPGVERATRARLTATARKRHLLLKRPPPADRQRRPGRSVEGVATVGRTRTTFHRPPIDYLKVSIVLGRLFKRKKKITRFTSSRSPILTRHGERGPLSRVKESKMVHG